MNYASHFPPGGHRDADSIEDLPLVELSRDRNARRLLNKCRRIGIAAIGIQVNFARLMAGLPSPGRAASIAIAPFVVLTVLIAASRYGRYSPASLLTFFGGALLATVAAAALAYRVMWGDCMGRDWPLVVASDDVTTCKN